MKKRLSVLAACVLCQIAFSSCDKQYVVSPLTANGPTPTPTWTGTPTGTPTNSPTATPTNLVTSWRMPNAPYNGVMGLSIHGSTLYAVEPISSSLYAYDLSGNPVAGWPHPSISHAAFCATDPNTGNVYMTTWVIVSTNNVYGYNPAGSLVTQWNPYGPNCIAVDPSSYVYTTNTSGWVEEYTGTGTPVNTWITLSGYGNMNGIAIHGSTIYVGGDDMTLYCLSMSGALINSWPIANTGFGIAFDGAGDIYVSGPGSNGSYGVPGPVQKFSPGGTLLAQWGSFASFGLAVDSSDNIYVGDNNTAMIYKFSGP